MPADTLPGIPVLVTDEDREIAKAFASVEHVPARTIQFSRWPGLHNGELAELVALGRELSTGKTALKLHALETKCDELERRARLLGQATVRLRGELTLQAECIGDAEKLLAVERGKVAELELELEAARGQRLRVG